MQKLSIQAQASETNPDTYTVVIEGSADLLRVIAEVSGTVVDPDCPGCDENPHIQALHDLFSAIRDTFPEGIEREVFASTGMLVPDALNGTIPAVVRVADAIACLDTAGTYYNDPSTLSDEAVALLDALFQLSMDVDWLGASEQMEIVTGQFSDVAARAQEPEMLKAAAERFGRFQEIYEGHCRREAEGTGTELESLVDALFGNPEATPGLFGNPKATPEEA